MRSPSSPWSRLKKTREQTHQCSLNTVRKSNYEHTHVANDSKDQLKQQALNTKHCHEQNHQTN
uniref:Uncharacterized protein n=1 Tax=Oryza brachyantha TaxID=4533 RepID=J3L297_ORYBR